MKRFLQRRFAGLRMMLTAALLSSQVWAQESDPNAPPLPDEAPSAQVELSPDDGGQNAVAEEPAPVGPSSEAVRATVSDQVEPEMLPAEEAAENEPTEVIQERYPNGTIKIERNMKRDAAGNYVLHGEWRQFDTRGTLIGEGRYKNSQREGVWKRYLRPEESKIFATSPYREFKGPFLSQAQFVGGQMHGTWYILDAKGLRVSEIQYDAGKRHGRALWYHATGRPAHEMNFVNGEIEGEVRQWDLQGQLTAKEVYEKGRRAGSLVEHYPNGQKKSQTGYLFAALVIKTPDDFWNAKLAEYETIGKDERHGHFVMFHDNGNKQRSGEYEHDAPVGKMTWWYPNGQKSHEGAYVLGAADGEWTWWYKNGQKSIVGAYENGRPAGDWNWWKEDGRLAQKADMSQATEVARAPAKSAGKEVEPVVPVPEVPLRR